MTSDIDPHLRVEVVQASTGPRLWAWAIYRGTDRTPLDCSQSMFPSGAVAMRVGTRIKDMIPALRSAAPAGWH